MGLEICTLSRFSPPLPYKPWLSVVSENPDEPADSLGVTSGVFKPFLLFCLLFGQGCHPLCRLLGQSFAFWGLYCCLSKWWTEDEWFSKTHCAFGCCLPQHWHCYAALFIIFGILFFFWPVNFLFITSLGLFPVHNKSWLYFLITSQPSVVSDYDLPALT